VRFFKELIMPKTRLPLIPSEQMNAEQLAVVEKLLASPRKGVRGPFAALLRNPALAERVMHIGDSIRFESSLPDVLREMTILMVAVVAVTVTFFYIVTKLFLPYPVLH
jgi:alkylhydroperoxidase family enzyme